jgi:phosphatidylglycerophosphatase A
LEPDIQHSEVHDEKLLEVEKHFKFKEQVGRAESEAWAQVAEQVLGASKWLNLMLFFLIACGMGIDQYDTVKGYYHRQIVSDELLGAFIAGVVLEIAILAFCLVRMPSLRRRSKNQ